LRFRVWGLGVSGLEFEVEDQGLGSRTFRFRFEGSGFRIQGAGFGVQGSGFRVQSSEFRVQVSGFRVRD